MNTQTMGTSVPVNPFAPIATGIKTVAIAGAANETAGMQSNKMSGSLIINKAIRLVRMYLTISSEGNVSIHRLDSFGMQTNQSLSGLSSLTAFVSTNMNEASFIPANNQKIRVYSDGNRGAIERLHEADAPYTSINLLGSVSNELIPSTLAWNNTECNKHVMPTWLALKAVAANDTLIDEDRVTKFQEIWSQYQALEQQLITRQMLISSNIIAADVNSIRTDVATFQNTELNNKFLSASKIYGTDEYHASYAPNNNVLLSVLKKLDISENELNGYKYGLTTITRDNPTGEITDTNQTDMSKDTAVDMSKTPEICSSAVVASNHVGRPVVMQSLVADAKVGNRLFKRAASFAKLPHGSLIFATSKIFPRQTVKGTLAIIFELRDMDWTVKSISAGIAGLSMDSSIEPVIDNTDLANMDFSSMFDSMDPVLPVVNVAPAASDLLALAEDEKM